MKSYRQLGIVAGAAWWLCLLASAPVSAQQQGNAAPAGDAKLGNQVYHADGCWECHGAVAQGGAITGPRLADTGLPFAAFLQQLRVPQNQMPPYEPAILSDADAANIYAYLKSLPPAPAAKNIPLLSD